jgi:hypothetical protein
MNTNIKIVTTDEERTAIAKNTGNPAKMVSRKDINVLVEGFIRGLIEGSEEAESTPDPAPERIAEAKPKAIGDQSIRGFVPSRGDEDYIAQPTDPGIAAACSRILDDVALIEEFAWNTVERNRKK